MAQDEKIWVGVRRRKRISLRKENSRKSACIFVLCECSVTPEAENNTPSKMSLSDNVFDFGTEIFLLSYRVDRIGHIRIKVAGNACIQIKVLQRFQLFLWQIGLLPVRVTASQLFPF